MRTIKSFNPKEIELKNLKLTLLTELFSFYANQADIFIFYFLKISKLIKILSKKRWFEL